MLPRVMSPLRFFDELRREMDSLFDRATHGTPVWGWRSHELPAVNVMGSDDAIVVTCELPGVKNDDVNISVTGDTLLIRGERKAEQVSDDRSYHRRERRVSRFSRSITLPTPVDADKAKANFEDGVLTIRIPKSPASQPRRIAVGSN